MRINITITTPGIMAIVAKDNITPKVAQKAIIKNSIKISFEISRTQIEASPNAITQVSQNINLKGFKTRVI